MHVNDHEMLLFKERPGAGLRVIRRLGLPDARLRALLSGGLLASQGFGHELPLCWAWRPGSNAMSHVTWQVCMLAPLGLMEGPPW